MHAKYARMRSQIKILQYATCGATLNVLTYLLKPMKKMQNDDVSAWYYPICVRSLPSSDLRSKELRIFLSSDTIESTHKTHKKNSEKTE